MSKIKLFALSIVQIIVFTFFIGEASAHIDLEREKHWKITKKISNSEKLIFDRLHKLNSDINIQSSRELMVRIRQYTNKNKKYTERILGNTVQYFPLIEKEIENRNLPDMLKYITIVESYVDPMATSKTGAAGIWQFVRGTGRSLGLEINSYVDERRDPIKSTQAALDYLQSLHQQFKDWSLAIAAYNAGPGTIRKAIRKSGGGKTFWEVKKFLPKETQDYYPRFLAAMYLVNYYYAHDLSPRLKDIAMLETTSTYFDANISLKQISQYLGVSEEILKGLNPQYIKGLIPDNNKSYRLQVPKKDADAIYKLHQTIGASIVYINEASEIQTLQS